MKDRRKGERRSSGAEQSVRINMNRLDNIMNLVSELVIYRTRLEELSAQYKATEITEPLEQVAKITSDLQELVLNIRMQPVSNVFNRYPRMVRDLSQELGKSINLIIEGEETELDRTLVTEINDPIVHILRNAIDHGIETVEDRLMVGKDKTGTVYLSAYQEGNKVIIKVEDDGKGINPAVIRKSAMEKGINVEGMTDEQVIQLIFGQGFSTKKEVTNVSGRGVGMEVVKSKISSIGGDVFVNSTVGRGTSIVIELPLTLSIIQALLVKVGDESFAIPLSVIEKVAEIYDGDIKCSHNEKVYIYKGKAIPVIHVTDILEIEDTSTETNMIIVKLGQQYYGLVVGSMLGQQEVVIKAIGETLPNIPVYVGATILGDGKITLILDVGNICNSEKEKGARNAI
jgi:two-component system chemotaxis sensor kinase CheA